MIDQSHILEDINDLHDLCEKGKGKVSRTTAPNRAITQPRHKRAYLKAVHDVHRTLLKYRKVVNLMDHNDANREAMVASSEWVKSENMVADMLGIERKRTSI